VVINLGSMATYVRTRHGDVDDVVDRGTIDIVHDQTLILAETRLAIAIGLPAGFALSVLAPLREVSTTIHYYDDSGAEVQLVRPGIHHRDETLVGLGDPMVLGSYGLALGDWRVTARAGATLPLGRTQPNPYLADAMIAPHEHIQMGTGTVDPVVAIEAARGWDRWALGAYALTVQSFYADSYGDRAGDRYATGVALSRHLGKRWTVDGGVAMQAETAERWSQTPHVTDGNRGRVDLMLDAGATWAAAKSLSLSLDVKVPVFDHVVGGQLEMPAIVELGASWSFGASEPPPITHPDARGLDVADVKTPAPVPHKTTIIDYWATWCEACKLLEPRLLELARSADNIAVRRIDVSDDDDFSATLPRLAVYDASGALVLERSADGDLPALLESVRVAIGLPPTARAVATTAHIRVTDVGFEPAVVTVPAGVPVTLTFERESTRSCATEVVIDRRIKKTLPLHQPVSITTTFATPGRVTYACGMDMLRGSIDVR